MLRLRVWRILLGANVRGKALREWFVHAAAQGRGARWAWLALAVVGVCLLVAQGFGALYVAHWAVWDSFPESWDEVWSDLQSCLRLDEDAEVRELAGPMYALWVGGAIATTCLELLALRWAFLWFRVRRLLSTRDRCFKCGYTIAGLPAVQQAHADGIDAWVTCAECAGKSPAVSAWGELVERPGAGPEVGAPPQSSDGPRGADPPADTGDVPSDRARFFRPSTPSDSRVIRVLWTPKRVRFVARFTALAVGLGVIAYSSWWTIREIGIRSQAAIARKDRPTAESINALMREGMPARVEGRRTVAEIIAQAKKEYDAINTDFLARHKDVDDKYDSFYPDASMISSARQELKTDEDRANKQYSLLLMEEIKASNVYKLLDELPDADRPTPFEFTPVDAVGPRTPGWMGSRVIVRICVARMNLARDVGDLEEFMRGAKDLQAISRWLGGGGGLIAWLLATSADQSLIRELSAALAPSIDRAWVDAISAVFAESPAHSLEASIEVERLWMLNGLGWYFSDPSRIRKGLGAPELEDKLGVGATDLSILGLAEPEEPGGPRPRLGTYEENRDAIGLLSDWAKRAATQDAFDQRLPDSPTVPQSNGLVILDYLQPVVLRVVRTRSQHTIPRRGLELMLLIERHRLDHETYPEKLEDLGPRAVSSALFDPFSGQPMRYKRIDPAIDEFHRGYLLWAVGYDAVDDGAKQSEHGQYNAVIKGGEGTDIIINDPHGLR